MHFIAVYTHRCKDYCEEQFFKRVTQLGGHLEIADNTPDECYTNHLRSMGLHVHHIDVPQNPQRTLFLRNVTESVNYLRDKFLSGKWDHFVIIESDVIPPVDVLNLFDEAADKADDWSAIGGLYYRGFHDFNVQGLQRTHHVLSGCTMYNRKLLEVFPFRWDKENYGAFPDAWWSHDINHKTGHKLYNYGKIRCQHLHDRWGRRGQEKIYR